MTRTPENRLGTFLKDRRARLDPAALGFSSRRRRTPGLRREEVAQRANISATWYTWLEQGRGGRPSAAVLDRVASALMLTEVEREHVFLIGRGHPPEPQQRAPEAVTPRLQRVLDALEVAPALVKTSTWDVLAWNRASTVILGDYGALPPEERNGLRQIFLNREVRAALTDWEKLARFVVATFRADVVRAGNTPEVEALVDDLCRRSADFSAMWHSNDVHAPGGGIKHLKHPTVGAITFEFSTFNVDGRPDLSLMVHNPATPDDADKVRQLVEKRENAQGPASP